MTTGAMSHDIRKPNLLGARNAFHRLTNTQTVTLDGVTVRSGKGVVSNSVRNELYKGLYERHERAILRAVLKPGDRVLEIGCGIGLISLICARICGAENVHSFEANAAMESVIRGNYALNGLAPKLTMAAVTADGRDLTFFRQSNVLSSSIFDRNLGGEPLTVASVAIDAICRDIRPDVLVMDVEGAEDELLPALPEADLPRAIVVEMHSHILGGERVLALCDELVARGYTLTEQRHKTYRFDR